MNAEKLRLHAELLEKAILDHRGGHSDADFLASYDPLLMAINDAKKGGVKSPRKLGLSYWEMESNIRSVPELSHRLAQFELLLEGWDLPSES
jgi:hypothetical protein